MINNRKNNMPPPLPKQDEKAIDEELSFSHISYEMVMDMIKNKCGNVVFKIYKPNTNKNRSGNDLVIFLPVASRELYNIIYWGERTPINNYEQLYMGMGHVFVDESGRRIIVISHVMYVYAAERNQVSAQKKTPERVGIMEYIDLERDIYRKNSKLCNMTSDGFMFDPFVDEVSYTILLGHTHPGLHVFFSEPDRKSSMACSRLPAVTFVADPINKELLAMVGIEESYADIIMWEYDSERHVEETKLESDPVIENTHDKAVADVEEGIRILMSERGTKGKISSKKRDDKYTLKVNLKGSLNDEMVMRE